MMKRETGVNPKRVDAGSMRTPDGAVLYSTGTMYETNRCESAAFPSLS
jgi:hypothetical protein